MTTQPAQSVGSTSSSLLQRVRQHDAEAWRRLVWLYGPLVSFWIRRKGIAQADADDVFQEVFRTVAAGIERFRRDRPGDSFRGWLWTITRSKIVDHVRRVIREPPARGGSSNLQRIRQVSGGPEPASDDPSGDPAEATALRELRRRSLELVQAEFQDRTWQMFWQVAVDARSAKDVAADFGVTASAVRLAKSRVLKRLREELEGLEPEAE